MGEIFSSFVRKLFGRTPASYKDISEKFHRWINVKKTKIDQHGNVAWPEQKNVFHESSRKKHIPNLLHFTKPAEHISVLFSQIVKILAKLNSKNVSCSKNTGFRPWCSHVNFERAFSSARINSRRHCQCIAKLSAVASGIDDFQEKNSLEPKKRLI